MKNSLFGYLLPLGWVGFFVGIAVASIDWRKWQMRKLAIRWQLEYLGSFLPDKFPLDRRRFAPTGNQFRNTPSVLAGECNGKKVLIFDAVVGSGGAFM